MTSPSSLPLLAVIGCTAVGKSACAVLLAKRYGGEVLSVDSRQVYRHLNETTGKLTHEAMEGIPHHLLDSVSPGTPYSVADFSRDASEQLTALRSRGHLAIAVGGTGFYLDALLFSGTFSPVAPHPSLRAQLSTLSTATLVSRLREKDPSAAKRVALNNRRRLIRALEIIDAVGSFPQQTIQPRMPFHLIGLRREKTELHDRIHARLLNRFSAMTEEIHALLSSGVSPSWLTSLGLECRFMTEYVTGVLTREETESRLFSAIVSYAKRQETWWKRYPTVHWYHPDASEALLQCADSLLSSSAASSGSTRT